MSIDFDRIAASVRFVRLQRNVDQETVANESGVSLRTIQNIEAGKAVNSASSLAYLGYLGLLDNMLSTLPAPNKLTPMELLETTPKRRKRAGHSINTKGKIISAGNMSTTDKGGFREVITNIAEVRLWGTQIGAVSWNTDTQYGEFQYSPELQGSGIEPCPIALPVGEAPYTFRSLNKDS